MQTKIPKALWQRKFVPNCATLPLAVAFSPSGCAIHCIPVGDNAIGKEIGCPNIDVDKSLLETSLIKRGLRRNLR